MNYELYFTTSSQKYGELECRLSRHIPAPFEILHEKSGKPYIFGNPIFFSLSDSGNIAAVALHRRPIGVDLELISGRTFSTVSKKFSPRELKEIDNEIAFLRHWTAREAYVKMIGESIFSYVKKLEFFGGSLYLLGQKLPVNIDFYEDGRSVCAVCTESL